MVNRGFVALCALVCTVAAPLAGAQTDFPSKPIRILVGFPPGGSTDLLARALAQEARKPLGQEIIVVNRPGASGVIADGEVAGAPPDGYTLGVSPSTALTLAHFFMNIRTDLLDSTTALIMVGRQRIGLVTQASSPARTLKDLVEQARSSPGKVSVGIPGLGTKVEVITRAIGLYEKVQFNVVPFQGDAGVATGLLGGHINAGSYAAGGWVPQVRGGTMRLLVSYEDDRFDVAPDVPTLKEMGYSLSSDNIQYLFGPKGLPPALAKRLVSAFSEASRSPGYVSVATENGLYDRNALVGEALEQFLHKDRNNNAELVQKLGLGLKKQP